MAQVIPCIKSKMGDTSYYQTTMKARELVSVVRAASEMDSWATMSIEERLQRELNQKRIDEEIVPYLVKSRDRFFGSLVVLVFEGKVTFEQIEKFGAKTPEAYRSEAKNLGFLMIDGGELIVLDGQHRMAALRNIIQEKTIIEGAVCRAEVPSDDISVIFIEHENNEKTRRIFNKINRYAKPTSRGDNIITSEDDGYAIVARKLLDVGAPLGLKDSKKELIVNWKSNTLSVRSKQLTTISAVYETVKLILAHEGFPHFDEKSRVNRPGEDELDAAYEVVESWWSSILSKMKPYQEALADTTPPQEGIKDVSRIPKMREAGESYSLLFKPVGQIAFVKGLIMAIQRKVDKNVAFDRANKCDWKLASDVWENIIARPDGKIIAKKEAIELTSELIAYFLSYDKMESKDKDSLNKRINRARGVEDKKDYKDLPSPPQ